MSFELQALVRAACGVLMLLTLLAALPHWRRYFLGERWGGYARPSFGADALHNPIAYPIAMALWLASGALVMLETTAVWAALAAVIGLSASRLAIDLPGETLSGITHLEPIPARDHIDNGQPAQPARPPPPPVRSPAGRPPQWRGEEKSTAGLRGDASILHRDAGFGR